MLFLAGTFSLCSMDQSAGLSKKEQIVEAISLYTHLRNQPYSREELIRSFRINVAYQKAIREGDKDTVKRCQPYIDKMNEASEKEQKAFEKLLNLGKKNIEIRDDSYHGCAMKFRITSNNGDSDQWIPIDQYEKNKWKYSYFGAYGKDTCRIAFYGLPMALPRKLNDPKIKTD